MANALPPTERILDDVIRTLTERSRRGQPMVFLFRDLMAVIDTQRFAELGEVWSGRKPAQGLAELCEISFQMANSYRVLHLRGMCYRDISKGNLMFDSRTGDVWIWNGNGRSIGCSLRAPA